MAQKSKKKSASSNVRSSNVRSRNAKGGFREKRGDTNMGTVEEKYSRDFGVRSDMHLETSLKRKKINSLNDLINSKLGKKG